MPETIDDLAQRWKVDPGPAATLALCEALRGAPRGDLVQRVGEYATQHHAGDVAVLVSVARMYLEAHRLGDAQAVLVSAGKLAPREGAIYRWLGETLLRRGDAERAEKVLERGIQLGVRDPDTQLWLERARVFRPMQAKAGVRAVAAEVAHATAPPQRAPVDSLSDSTTAVHVRPLPGEEPGAAAADADDEPTRMGPQPSLASAAGVSARAPAASLGAAAAAAPARRFPQHAETEPRPFEVPKLAPMRAPEPSASSEIEISVQQALPVEPAPFPPRGRAPEPPPPPPPAVAPAAMDAPRMVTAEMPGAPALPAPVPTAPPIPARSGSPFEPAREPSTGLGRDRSAFAKGADQPMVPHPRDVLDALTLAGIYEPAADGATAVAWAAAEKGPKGKGAATLIAGMAMFLAASVGVYFFYRHKRAQEHLQAEAILQTVEAELHAGKPSALPDAEKQLAQAFQLESRSPRAALDWIRDRALVGLIQAGGDIAFEDAMARAKEVGIPEERYAFARVASFLFQGDTAGAAAVLPRWDGPAGTDAWYSLIAGATLERAGDAHARERYGTAAKLDPDLVVAQIAQARATAIDGDAQEAMRLARALRQSLPDRVEPVALVALAWGRDINRESLPPPPEVDELGRRVDELPLGLRYVPHAVAALRALDKHATDEARAQVQKGLAVADSPGSAVWLGTIALPLGDEALARKGALAGLHFSAVYEPARALAARVALLGGRLDEALKATEDLEANTPDVAVVRAAAAYERVDADGVTRALEGLTPDARKLPFLAALDLAPDALGGTLQLDGARLMTMATDDAPWSDVVAMDTALDLGDLATADKIAEAWGKDSEARALRALRLARLARYENRLDQADALSMVALERGTVTPRALWERVMVLVARSRGAEVGPLLGRYPLVLGPLATWLSAMATASAGNVESAKGKTASSDPPPASAPFETRVIAAAAYGAMKDKRRGSDYVKELLSKGNLHPDLVAAALELGFKKVDHGKRRPTYE